MEKKFQKNRERSTPGTQWSPLKAKINQYFNVLFEMILIVTSLALRAGQQSPTRYLDLENSRENQGHFFSLDHNNLFSKSSLKPQD